MKHFLLDSSVLVSVLRDRGPGTKIVKSLDGEISTSTVCVAELYEGTFRSRKVKENVNALESLLASLDKIYSFDCNAGKQFGKNKAVLVKRGEVIADMDLQIAATCLAENLTLVTLNYKHFQRIPKLKIYKM